MPVQPESRRRPAARKAARLTTRHLVFWVVGANLLLLYLVGMLFLFRPSQPSAAVPVAVRGAPYPRVTLSVSDVRPTRESLERSAGPDRVTQKLGRLAPAKQLPLGASPIQKGRMVWPTEGRVVTSSFGGRLDPVWGAGFQAHRGVDVRSECGTPVVATAKGTVMFADWAPGAGNNVKLRHDARTMSRYAHLSRIDVSAGEKVVAGQQIGLSGATGRSTGPHLHFEIWRNGRTMNPLAFRYQHLPSRVFAHPPGLDCGPTTEAPLPDLFSKYGAQDDLFSSGAGGGDYVQALLGAR